MSQKIRRLRRCQLAVPGSNARVIAKAAASRADHVFCDLEDAVAPNAKQSARETVVDALRELDWGKKTRCVRVNDVRTPWCHEDVITLVEKAGDHLDTIMVPKALCASDVHFFDHLLTQLEDRLGMTKRIGIELLIEEVQALANVEAIAAASPRVEAIIFGMGDYSASQQIDPSQIHGNGDYPGDLFHYPRFRIAMAAHAAGVDPIDGPFGDFRDEASYRRECRRSRTLGFCGKWAIHPSQIETALDVFSPSVEAVAKARAMTTAYENAQAEGVGSLDFNGTLVDAASVRLVANVIRQAELIGI